MDKSKIPDETVTSAGFAVMAARFAVLDAISSGSGISDVDDHWAAGYIAAAVNAEYISGYPDGLIVERPKRKLLLKCAKTATDYFAYCDEVGCDVWGILVSVKEALYEPVGCWLPLTLRPAGASEYAQGVEVPFDYSGEVPEGFDLIDLPACKMMIFQGEPYKDEDFEEAIGAMWAHIPKFNPHIFGYEWADEDAPRMQLEPQGWRGYIEMRPVKEVNK